MTDQSDTECFFMCSKSGELLTSSEARLKNIIQSSIQRNDNLHIKLQENLDKDPHFQIRFHRDCVSTYTSKHHIERHRKRAGTTSCERPEPKPKRRSQDGSFDFRKDCLVCGKTCQPKDPKHPLRWRRVIQCRTVEIKDSLVRVCKEREDDLACAVRMRILSAVSDLHAADAQYHFDCFSTFTSKRNISSAKSSYNSETGDISNAAFEGLVLAMEADRSKIWTSVEAYDVYSKNILHGTEYVDVEENVDGKIHRSKRVDLIQKLEKHYGDALLVLKITGCASMLCFREYVPESLKLVSADDTDSVHEVVKLISNEMREKKKVHTTYDFQDFTQQKAQNDTSETLLRLMNGLATDKTQANQALSLAQSIQGTMTKTFNQTTLGLAVKLHHKFGSKELIDVLHKHGYISSYDEVKRFRKSAAKFTGENKDIHGDVFNSDGLVSTWFDNFDLNISTPNGTRETHAMAVEMLQFSQDMNDFVPSTVIPRVSKKEMGTVKLQELSPIVYHQFNGQKKPLPPVQKVLQGMSYKLLKQLDESVHKAFHADYEWLMAVTSNPDSVPEWSGFMSKAARDDKLPSKGTTKYVFGPLIDAPPSSPDTVLTTLIYIEDFMRNQQVHFIHICADMQLFKVVMQIKWSSPERWSRVVVRPGGMHTLMSFLGSIGTLMASSGLETILGAAYKGIPNILNGKAWPKALRAYRMVLAALLKPFIESGISTFEELLAKLEETKTSRTARLWVESFIIPTEIAHMYLRAEREGDWLLHLYCLKRMVPYLFASGHWNYARYITFHIQDMEASLPDEILTSFLKGEHVCRHSQGVWNSIFLDQFGEQTYIRYGKAKGGLVGKTLSQEQVAGWVLSHHLCNTLSLAYDRMQSDDLEVDDDEVVVPHKEEGRQRTQLDATDRHLISNEVQKYTNPLLTDSSAPLHNIATGRLATENINVDKALEIGEKMAFQYSSKLPDGFYTPLHKEVVTMEATKKGVKVGDRNTFDLEKFYARLLVVSQKREVKLDELFRYELAPVPSALFDDYGDMRSSAKSPLMNKLAVFRDGPLGVVDAEIVDGNEALYHVQWPKVGTVGQFAESFCGAMVRPHETYVIFDKYLPGSIKSQERFRRSGGNVLKEHTLHVNTAMPARDTIMKHSNNKKKLIRVICETKHSSRALHLIDEQNCAFEHEEADVNIIAYLLQIQSQRKHIVVRSDDTDVFVLLVYFTWKHRLSCQISMQRYDHKVIDINASAAKLGPKCNTLLPLHAITGCDSVSYPFGKGKLSAVKLLLSRDINLGAMCDPSSVDSDVLEAATEFLLRIYGGPKSGNLDTLRYQIFAKKRDPPKLRSLPPTTEAASEHIKRARLQTLIWCAADKQGPPQVDVSKFGWKMNEQSVPVPVQGPRAVAPAALLQVVACSCKSATPCGTHRCSCRSAGLSCTSYCKCEGAEICNNENTSTPVPDTDDSDID